MFLKIAGSVPSADDVQNSKFNGIFLVQKYIFGKIFTKFRLVVFT